MKVSMSICFYSFIALVLISLTRTISADDRKSAVDLIKSRGFDVEQHDIISQNYVLRLYHIRNPLADPKTLHKIPVVASHGINFDIANMLGSSKNARPRRPKVDERVTLYAMENGTDDRGLHFYISNNNYDVWLIEFRATNELGMYRLPATREGENSKAFWDFSIDEQALIDLPLHIDYVLKKTGAPKVAYIAYSQSTTLMFALLSMRPEYADKLATFIALAPVVFTSNYRGIGWPLVVGRIYSHTSSAIPNAPKWLRKTYNFFFTYLCSISLIKDTLCKKAWEEVTGSNVGATLDGGMTDNVLKSTSLKSLEQFGQNSDRDDFRMYDYKDELRNMEEYGQTVPPQYNISKITLKTICLFRGAADDVSDPKDQMYLLNRLKVPLYEDHIFERYTHIDFLASPTVTRDINEPILRILDKLTNRPVKTVSHTLGNPNPQVQGTQLVVNLNTKRPDNLIEPSGSHKVFSSQPKAERPTDGVVNPVKTTSIHEEVFS